MAEMERLRGDESKFKLFARLWATSKIALEKALNLVKELEKDRSDELNMNTT
jgi:hypothetical protein